MAQTDLYPLRFDPIYKQKVWGGRALEKLGRTLPGDDAVGIGESWEIADLATTAVSGGGGNAEHSVVAEGPLAGKSIRELMETYGQALLGEGVAPAADGGFPLLIKFLDAKENLSVQVHPSPDYAAAHPGAQLKSEAWYVVDAQPGAVIYKGLKPGVTAEQLRAALETNTDQAVAPLLNALPVRPGDCHYLPSGTLHALGAGVLIAEVQTPSDTTFRVYDWGRTDRELHIEQAMACINFASAQASGDVVPRQSGNGFDVMSKASCEFFAIDACASSGPAEAELQPAGAEVWIAVAGDGVAAIVPRTADAGRTEYALTLGQTLLVPATTGPIRLTTDGPGCWLRVTLPVAAR